MKLLSWSFKSTQLWVVIWRKQNPLIRRDIYTPLFIAALFTIAKLWKQPKCPSIDEGKKKIWYIYRRTYPHTNNGILLSHREEWNLAIWDNMLGPRRYYAKWNKSIISNIIQFHLYVESKKNKTKQMNKHKKKRNRVIDTENKQVFGRREGIGGRKK